jgi:hypothetical protein
MRFVTYRTIIGVLFTMLSACADDAHDAPAPPSPRITQHPLSLSIAECQGAVFTVSASSDGPVSYQWFSDDLVIPGATGRTYEVPRAGLPSSGKRFSVQIRNESGTVMSEEAVLTVTAADGPVLLAPSDYVFELVSDGSELFWTDGNTVQAVAVDCEGVARTLYERPGLGTTWEDPATWENTDAITLAGDRVLWTDSVGGRITAATKDGLWVGRMAELGMTRIWGITVSDQDVFWISVSFGIQKAPLAGGAITTLAPGFVNSDGLAVDDRGVYWYVLASADSVVMQVPRDGGDTAVLVSGLAFPSGIGTDGAFVYVADTAGRDTDAPVGRILRVSRDGGEPTVLATEPVEFKRLALDDAFVYWTSGNTAQPGSGSVSRIALDGTGTRTVLADGLTRAFHLAIGDRYVYWADRDGVKRLRKQ